jgi:hypothetical protein
VVTVEASFLKHGRLVLVLKEWPGECYFAEHFRPVQNHTEEHDVAKFLPLLRGEQSESSATPAAPVLAPSRGSDSP